MRGNKGTAQDPLIAAILRRHGISLRALAQGVGYTHQALGYAAKGKGTCPRLMRALRVKGFLSRVGPEAFRASGRCPSCGGSGEAVTIGPGSRLGQTKRQTKERGNAK